MLFVECERKKFELERRRKREEGGREGGRKRREGRKYGRKEGVRPCRLYTEVEEVRAHQYCKRTLIIYWSGGWEEVQSILLLK